MGLRTISSAVAFGVAALLAPAAQATVVVNWNKAALTEVRLSNQGPPIAARALAIAHTCMYDAWAAYDRRAVGAVSGASLRRPPPEHTDANKAKAISFAAYRCLVNLYPAGIARLTSVMQSLGYNPNDDSGDVRTPEGVGNVAARAVIDSRRNDGSNQYGDLFPGAYSDYTGYRPRNQPLPFCWPLTAGPCPPLNVADPLRWQPLISDSGRTQSFIAPHWERVAPFALTSANQYDDTAVLPAPNIFRNSGQYQADVNEALKFSKELDLQRKVIVEYWADGPDSELPPGHWGLFAQFVSARDRHSIDQDVKMFFAMHNASFDAGIVGWHVKRRYDGVRPITAVRYLNQGKTVIAWGGPGRLIEPITGEKWIPYNPGSNLTPSFPGYISGHSVFSNASAKVLELFTGSDNFGFSAVVPPDFGRVEPGIPPAPTTLSYATFSAAADEASISRLYGGIHFRDDVEAGQRVGTLIGEQAWAKAQSYFNAPAQGFAALALDGAKVKIDSKNESSGIFGDAAIGPSAKQELSRGFIDGTLFVDPMAQEGRSRDEVLITGGTVDRSLAQATADAQAVSADAAMLQPTRVMNDIKSSQTIVGNGGRNVIRVKVIELKREALTLQGTSKDEFIINVTERLKLDDRGAIRLAGAVVPSQVLFNLVGGKAEAKVEGGSQAIGTILVRHGKVEVKGVGSRVVGAVVAGKEIMLSEGGRVQLP